mmetsp:Transcript_511/g.846  ORF Transcript_511/g.846 Transcript_511/m.846 type:complete len:553 (+) Transcript_511:181-1839(+)
MNFIRKNPLPTSPNEAFYLIELPNGSQQFDIGTKEGATAFIQATNGMKYISRTVAALRQIRSSQEHHELDQGMMYLESSLFFLPANADKQVFGEMIPQAEFQIWLDYVIDELKKLVANPTWINSSGYITEFDFGVWRPIAPMMGHSGVANLAFQGDFFPVLTQVVKACESLPEMDTCEHVTKPIAGAFTSATWGLQWPVESVFEKLEASGALEQFFKCLLVPQPHGLRDLGFDLMMTDLEGCPRFLRNHLCKGKPCGDAVSDMCDGNYEPTSNHPQIIKRLKEIFLFVEAMDKILLSAPNKVLACNYCSESDRSEAYQQSLKRCSRCKSVYYCSKECQRAHWRYHKQACLPVTDHKAEKRADASRIIGAFLQKHYVRMMARLVETCDGNAGAASVNDMVVEIDFTTNKDDIIPAMQNPPIFKIAPIQAYRTGREKPEFLSCDIDRCPWDYEGNTRNAVGSIEREDSRTVRELIFLVNYGGTFYCFKPSIYSSYAGFDETVDQDYSERAVDAFRSAIHDENIGPMIDVFPTADWKQFVHELVTLGVLPEAVQP